MKKVLLSLVLTAFFAVSFAQTAQEKRTQYFVDEAVETFQLDKKQQKELMNERTAYTAEYSAVYNAKKKGEITPEVAKEKGNAINKEFKATMKRITGKTDAELKPFYNRVQKEMKAIK